LISAGVCYRSRISAVVFIVAVSEIKADEARIDSVHFLMSDGMGSTVAISVVASLSAACRDFDGCIDQSGEVLNAPSIGISVVAPVSLLVVPGVAIIVVGFVAGGKVWVGIPPHQITLVE